MAIPPILCVTGPSGSGKTRLLERVIDRLTGQSLRVAAVKHCRHIDRGAANTDSGRLARAGAVPVVAFDDHEIEIRPGRPVDIGRAGGPPSLMELAGGLCGDSDLVLAEGFTSSVFDKILLRASDGKSAREPEAVRLVVGSGQNTGQIDRDDIEALTQWVLAWFGRRRAFREGLTAAVLTGGESRRMGADKSRLTVAGRSVLARLCELLADRAGQVMVVGREPDRQEAPSCVTWRADIRPGLGPLGGIATALQAAADRGVCVVACDMPAIGGELLDCLLAGRDRDAFATVAVGPGGRLEPLFAVYELRARESIEAALAAGRLSATEWLAGAGAHLVRIPKTLAEQLANVNTPEALESHRRKSGSQDA